MTKAPDTNTRKRDPLNLRIVFAGAALPLAMAATVTGAIYLETDVTNALKYSINAGVVAGSALSFLIVGCGHFGKLKPGYSPSIGIGAALASVTMICAQNIFNAYVTDQPAAADKTITVPAPQTKTSFVTPNGFHLSTS